MTIKKFIIENFKRRSGALYSDRVFKDTIATTSIFIKPNAIVIEESSSKHMGHELLEYNINSGYYVYEYYINLDYIFLYRFDTQQQALEYYNSKVLDIVNDLLYEKLLLKISTGSIQVIKSERL